MSLDDPSSTPTEENGGVHRQRLGAAKRASDITKSCQKAKLAKGKVEVRASTARTRLAKDKLMATDAERDIAGTRAAEATRRAEAAEMKLL